MKFIHNVKWILCELYVDNSVEKFCGFLPTFLSTAFIHELQHEPTKLSILTNPVFSRVSRVIHIFTAPTANTTNLLIIYIFI